MNDPVFGVLVIVALVSFVSLIIQCAQWFMHDGLSKRVAKLEANQANQMTQEQVIYIRERLASLDTEMKTQGTSLRSIQEHSLENDT